MQQSIPLKAGQTAKVSAPCRTFIIEDCGAEASITVSVEFKGGASLEELGQRQRGFKFRTLDASVSYLHLTAANDTTVTLLTSGQNIDVSTIDGASVTATIDVAQLPLEVSNDRGSPGNLLYVSGVTLADAPATGLDDAAPVNVTDALTAVLAVDANRREVRITNQGADPVAIGGASLTWARRVVVLEAGDTWIEQRAANLAIKAICAAGTTATIGVQTVTA